MTDNAGWIGIDGGGTKTKAYLISKDGKLLAESLGGSSNQNSVGFNNATQTLKTCCEELLRQANRDSSDVQGVCAGLSGCDRENDKKQFTAFFLTLYPTASIQLYNDGVLALTAGTEGKLHGIVIISGTGSIAVGFHEKKGNQQFRASGWGPLLGEEGGGYIMGNDCLIAVAREADGRGPKTMLTPLILEKLALDKPEGLIGWRYADMSFARPAALTPQLFEAASKNDTVALQIVTKGVTGLCEAVESVYRQLEFTEQETVPIVLAGSNLTHEGSILQASFRSEILKRIPNSIIKLPTMDAAMAAALLALNNNE